MKVLKQRYFIYLFILFNYFYGASNEATNKTNNTEKNVLIISMII